VINIPRIRNNPNYIDLSIDNRLKIIAGGDQPVNNTLNTLKLAIIMK
jgi:hypothetical protein